MTEKIILKVTENESTGQRRINIPKKTKGFEKDQLVKVEEVEVK
jgi:hypothetical protein